MRHPSVYDERVSATVNTREHQRVVIDALVKIAGSAGNEQPFRTRDISLSGLFLYTRLGQLYDFKVGSTLDIELLDGDRGIHAKVVVVRIVSQESSEQPGFACKIVGLSDSDRSALSTLLSSA